MAVAMGDAKSVISGVNQRVLTGLLTDLSEMTWTVKDAIRDITDAEAYELDEQLTNLVYAMGKLSGAIINFNERRRALEARRVYLGQHIAGVNS